MQKFGKTANRIIKGLVGRAPILFFLVLLIFTRFYNVANTARFTRDESYDILKLHQYWREKRITLVGAIDYTGSIVYSSLFYYTIMPFAVIANFEPQSSVYAVAFYGIITALTFVMIVKLVNKKFLFLAAVLVLVWFPLVQSSRWSWNPHLIALWMSLGVLSYLKGKRLFLFLSGVFFGLAFHIHYISFISVACFLVPLALVNFWRKRFIEVILPFLGFSLLIIPFAIFDLRHPPGLFFTGYLRKNLVSEGISQEWSLFWQTYPINIQKSFFYLTQSQILSELALVLLGGLIYFDTVKGSYKNLLYVFPVPFQIAIISFLPTFGDRYFLPALIFLFVYLISPRKGFGDTLGRLIILAFIVGGVATLKSNLTKPILEPGPRVVGEVAKLVRDKVLASNLKNVNIAVLASPDPDPLGATYRDVLQTKGVEVLPPSQYLLTDNLFVVTTAEEERVRDDPANIMDGFRGGKLADKYFIKDSNWKIYLFERSQK